MTEFQCDLWVWVEGSEDPVVEWADPETVLTRADFLRSRGQVRRGVTLPVRRLLIGLFRVYHGEVASWDWSV